MHHKFIQTVFTNGVILKSIGCNLSLVTSKQDDSIKSEGKRGKVVQLDQRPGGPGGGGHSTSQVDRGGGPLGGGGGSKPDPVIMRSAHEKYTLSFIYLTKNIQMHTLLQYIAHLG